MKQTETSLVFIQTRNYANTRSAEKDVHVSLPPAAENCARPAPSSVCLSASARAAVGLFVQTHLGSRLNLL